MANHENLFEHLTYLRNIANWKLEIPRLIENLLPLMKTITLILMAAKNDLT